MKYLLIIFLVVTISSCNTILENKDIIVFSVRKSYNTDNDECVYRIRIPVDMETGHFEYLNLIDICNRYQVGDTLKLINFN